MEYVISRNFDLDVWKSLSTSILNLSHESESKRFVGLIRLLAFAYLVLIAVTARLWLPQLLFPQVPFLRFAIGLPFWFDGSLLVVLAGALIGLLATGGRRYQRLFCSLIAASTIGLVILDQHRLQPWTWQFLLLILILLLADDQTSKRLWRWLVIGIYVWSAWSKLDWGFFGSHGVFLVEGLFRAVGLTNLFQSIPENPRFVMALSIPIVELSVAILLMFRRTRRVGFVGSIIMHLALLLILGPFGHNHQLGVLVWNGFFIAQNWLLFSSEDAVHQPAVGLRATSSHPGNTIASAFIIAALTWPCLE